MAADVSLEFIAERMNVQRDVAVRIEQPNVDVPVRDVLEYIAVLIELAPALTQRMLRIENLADASRKLIQAGGEGDP